jgi:hypothetical protein
MESTKTVSSSSSAPATFLRPDFLFSYWIFLWGLIYLTIFAFFKNTNKYTMFIVKYCNPLIIFIFALFENIYLFIRFIVTGVKTRTIVLFAIMVLFAKIIPISLLLYTKINIMPNLKATAVVFAVYNLYLLLHGTNIYEVYVKTTDIVVKEKTPFIYLVNSITKWLS